jgi:hypothetical protein
MVGFVAVAVGAQFCPAALRAVMEGLLEEAASPACPASAWLDRAEPNLWVE